MDALAMYPAEKIAIAGEGTGAVMLPEFRFVYDGMASLLALASLIVNRESTLRKLLLAWPGYDMRKLEVALDSKKIPSLMMRLEERYGKFPRDTRDGLRVELPKGWFHVRVSNTEPVVRIMAEMREGSAESLAQDLLQEVKSYA
jgi:phosphomannomutase